MEITTINPPSVENRTNVSTTNVRQGKVSGSPTPVVPSLSAWGSVIFVIVTVLVSFTLTGLVSTAILRNRKSKHISYLYIVSMSTATVIHASINFPSSVIFDLIDSTKISDKVCTIWIFLETAICHSILLHLLGSSLDTYLRLHMPQWYGLSGGRPATVRLKLAAPWIVSSLQTTAQILLGDPLPPAKLEDQRLCTCPDVNFLILRTSVAFAFPLLVSVVILFLAAHKLQCSYRAVTKMDSFEAPERALRNERGGMVCASRRMKLAKTKPGQRERSIVYPNAPVIQKTEEKSIVNHKNEDEFCANLRTTHSAVTLEKNYYSSSLIVQSPQPVSASPCYQPTFQCQQLGQPLGSGSSDTGISSQTTDENDEIINLKRPIAQVINPPTISLNTASRSPYGTIVGLLESNRSDREVTKPVTVMDHFCPQHGHVTLSLQPDVNFKSKLSPLVEHESSTAVNTIDAIEDSVYTSPTLLQPDKIEVNPVAFGALTSPLLYSEHKQQPSLNQMHNEQQSIVQHGLVDSPAHATFNMDEPVKPANTLSTHQYHLEQASIKLNMITCALSIALWAPFITASLAHLLLSTTRFSRLISVSTLIQFKWLSYMSSVAYLIGYLVVDRQLCRLVVQHCRRNQNTVRAGDPSVSANSTAYTCLTSSNGQ